jgi:hypothetical protein
MKQKTIFPKGEGGLSLKMKLLCCLFFLFPGGLRSLYPQEVFRTDFESQRSGSAYRLSNWENDGFKASWEDGLDTRSFIDSTQAVSGKKSLRITYPKDSVGPSGNGAQVSIVLPEQSDYYLSYWLRFSDNFSFQLGGKLPGLAAGELCSGGQVCDGTNGFTARFMWRRGGRIVLYLYHMDKKGQWGDDVPLVYPSGEDVSFERGKWYQITERVKANSADTAHDGEVDTWVNGIHVLLLKGIRFTSNGEGVNRFYFSTFHGGSTAEWAPAETCFLNVDDILISSDEKYFKMTPSSR